MLTLAEWVLLDHKERGERYKEMNDHDRFLARIGEYSVGVDITKPYKPSEKTKRELVELCQKLGIEVRYTSQEPPADDHKEQNTSTETK